MKLKVLIVDDEPLARDIISAYLNDFSEVAAVREAVNGLDALKVINEESFDLLFLDIQMPKMDGMALLNSEKLLNHPPVIFTTAYDQYAIRAFELNAIDYLMKPFDRARFHQTMQKALDKLSVIGLRDFQMEFAKFRLDYENAKLEQHDASYPLKLVVKDSKRIKHIEVDTIVTIQAAGDYVEINESDGKFLLYKSITDVQDKLNPNAFRRIHKSVIININMISEIRSHGNGEFNFYLKNGEIMKSGRTYKESIADLINRNI